MTDTSTRIEEAEAEGLVAAGPAVPEARPDSAPRGDAPQDDGPHDDERSSSSSGSSSDDMNDQLAMALGVVRLGVGAALLAAPGWAGRIWVGPGADGPGSKVFARALGARDVALGLRILQGNQKGEPVGHWIAAGFAADFADVAATVIASKHLTPARRLVMPLIGAAVGAAGVMAANKAQDPA